jgi:hypothetical protein
MDKSTFRNYCAEQMHQVYQATKDGRPDFKLKHRTEGLLLAGEMLDIVNRDEALQIIEEEHMKVFGETIPQRQKRKKQLSELRDTSPDAYFNIPAIERKR